MVAETVKKRKEEKRKGKNNQPTFLQYTCSRRVGGKLELCFQPGTNGDQGKVALFRLLLTHKLGLNQLLDIKTKAVVTKVDRLAGLPD